MDDLGRQCVTRDRARALFAERAEAERQHREAQERHQDEPAEQNRSGGGIPIPERLEGVDAVTVMMQHDIMARAERKGARQRSTLDEMFTGVMEYHPISDREEP